MKKLIALFLCVALLGSLSGCAGTTVVVGNCTCPPDSHENTPATEVLEQQPTDAPVEGALKTGIGVVAHAMDSKAASADANGKVKYDVTVAAVTVDEKGIIRDCIIDSIAAEVAFDAAGLPVDFDPNAEILTKNELGDAYGMKAYAGAKYEWYEQAEAVAKYAVGKTYEQLRRGAVNESGYAADADLASTATISIGSFVDAIGEAVFYADYLGAQEGDELKLAVIGSAEVTSTDGLPAAETGCTATLNVDMTALTVNGEVITSCVIDSVQAKVGFDTKGSITSGTDGLFASKNSLGEQYGMVAWGGAKAEWNQQAASFAAYVTGKTAADVAGIAVSESTKPADGTDLAASVTIAIGGFQALIAKACQG